MSNKGKQKSFGKLSFQHKINQFQEIEIDLFEVYTKTVKLFCENCFGHLCLKYPRPSLSD